MRVKPRNAKAAMKVKIAIYPSDTMGGIVQDAGLTIEDFREAL
jgi:hypothetical protein